MSKNQILSQMSPSNFSVYTKKIPIKFIPIMRNSSKKDIKSLSKPNFSISKSRENIILNSSIQPHKKNHIKSAEHSSIEIKFTKQATTSTEDNSDNLRDLHILESKIRLFNSDAEPKEKYFFFLEIWPEVTKRFSTLGTILNQIKNGLIEYISQIEEELERYKKNISGYNENKHTLKILKRRFQKLAVENLEINNLIKENENSFYRKKEHLKSIIKENKAEISEKNKIIENLNGIIQNIIFKLNTKKIDDFTDILTILTEYELKRNQSTNFNMNEHDENKSLDVQQLSISGMQNISSIEMRDEYQMPNPSNHEPKASSFFFSGSEVDFNNLVM